ncbi:TonB family protein [Hansschlegelia quercus]|nr:TonB family protein [Hansschlegelia quercus]
MRLIRSAAVLALLASTSAGAMGQTVGPRGMSRYATSIYSLIFMYSRPPHASNLVGGGGAVVVQFSIDRQGKLVQIRAIRGAGRTTYDDAAKQIVRNASRFFPAPPPQEMTGDFKTFVIPISFGGR